MTEQEIIDFLKKNKETGTAFAFMPIDVRDWVNDASRKIVYLIFKGGLWEELPTEATANEEDIFALPDSFQIKQEPQGGWVEFEINQTSKDFLVEVEKENCNDCNEYYCWFEVERFLRDSVDNDRKYTAFGGWQYVNCETWFMCPMLREKGVSYHNADRNKDYIGAVPVKIRFWRESQ